MQMLINAGGVPPSHWARDATVGGGRIIGEACHFLDLAMFLVGRQITSVQAIRMTANGGVMGDDSMSIHLTFFDGSIATVHYWVNGPKSYPKERVEIFSEGRVLRIENWRGLRAYDWRGVPRMRQDKGHRAEAAQFVSRLMAGGEPLVPFTDIDLVTAASFAAVRSARASSVFQLAPTTKLIAAENSGSV